MINNVNVVHPRAHLVLCLLGSGRDGGNPLGATLGLDGIQGDLSDNLERESHVKEREKRGCFDIIEVWKRNGQGFLCG